MTTLTPSEAGYETDLDTARRALRNMAEHLQTIAGLDDIGTMYELVTALGSNGGPNSAKVELSEIRAMLVRALVDILGNQHAVSRELRLSQPTISRMVARA